MTKRLYILAALLVILPGCREEKGPDFLLSQSEISLSWKGERQVTYSSDSYQISFNDSRNEYRIYDDRIANWFTVRCSQKPVSQGQTLTADVAWTGKKGTKSFSGAAFRVEKVNEEGLIWLISESARTGIIIKDIQ